MIKSEYCIVLPSSDYLVGNAGIQLCLRGERIIRCKMTLHRLANIQVCVGVASVAVGILLVIGPGTALFSTYEESIAVAIIGMESFDEGQSNLVHWLLSTCGAGVVGWGIVWIMISHIPLRRGERWAYRCLWISLLAWAVLDFFIAWWFGVTGEMVFVFCAFFVASFPLLLSRRLFTKVYKI